MSKQNEIHNRIAPDVVRQIVREPLGAGGEYTDVLMILESVIVGVMLVAVKYGGDEVVLDAVIERAKSRIKQQRQLQ